MAYTSRPITVNEGTAGLRTVFFAVWNTADGTAKTDLAAATALIHTNSGSGVASTNNFAHVSNGRYSLVLTQAEVNLAANTHLTIGPAHAAGYVVTPAEVLIVPAVVAANTTQLAGQTVTAAAGVTFPTSVASPTNITAATGVVLSGVTHTGAVIPTVTTTGTATNVTTVNGLAANVITATSIATDAITAAKIAADAIGASELATDAVNEIVSAVFARAFNAKMSSLTFEELTALMATVLLGKASGMGTATGTFRNLADNADAVVATQDADGNRTAVTRTAANVR